MKIKKLIPALALCAAVMAPASASAFDLKDLLGSAGGAVENIVEGLFTSSNIEVKDLKGEWVASGSAVAFQDENFLKQAGGAAAAGAIENKLDPYYEKYGLTGSTITIQEDGTFSMKVGKISVGGTIVKGKEKGIFEFEFQAFGKISLGKMKTYVEKGPSSLNIMFDATTLKKVIGAVTAITGNKLVSSVGSIIDSYEGLCVGFKYDKVKTDEDSNSGVVDGLLNILKGNKK
ncbi:MAG: DUF4923 family protein [Bacteroides sp.]|nr:DUF4923 family protein [Bacteroides sp.]MBD5337400.1 DUF4923 family protein [Bacteroides sp.]